MFKYHLCISFSMVPVWGHFVPLLVPLEVSLSILVFLSRIFAQIFECEAGLHIRSIFPDLDPSNQKFKYRILPISLWMYLQYFHIIQTFFRYFMLIFFALQKNKNFPENRNIFTFFSTLQSQGKVRI